MSCWKEKPCAEAVSHVLWWSGLIQTRALKNLNTDFALLQCSRWHARPQSQPLVHEKFPSDKNFLFHHVAQFVSRFSHSSEHFISWPIQNNRQCKWLSGPNSTPKNKRKIVCSRFGNYYGRSTSYVAASLSGILSSSMEMYNPPHTTCRDPGQRFWWALFV